MEKVRFGKTELMVSKIAFGGIPIQRVSHTEAAAIVRGAINLGINFIDTANAYSDSEEKIGLAIKDMPRDSIVLATKSTAQDKKTFLEHLDLSLKPPFRLSPAQIVMKEKCRKSRNYIWGENKLQSTWG